MTKLLLPIFALAIIALPAAAVIYRSDGESVASFRQRCAAAGGKLIPTGDREFCSHTIRDRECEKQRPSTHYDEDKKRCMEYPGGLF